MPPAMSNDPLQNPLLLGSYCAVSRGSVTAGDSAIYARILTLRAQRIGLCDLKVPCSNR